MAQLNLEGQEIRGTARDHEIMNGWSTVKVTCPWCLHQGPLSGFATWNTRKVKGHLLSLKNAECPDCKVSIRVSTLVKLHHLSLFEYSYWFWDSVFRWGAYEKVSWDKLKGRMRGTRLERWFWDVWRAFKQDRNISEEDCEGLIKYWQAQPGNG